MTLRGGTILAASICFLATPASAQETYRLDYLRGSGTDNCPSEAAFRAAITREVGRDPFRPDAPNLLTVIFRRSDKIVRVGIVAKNASGSEEHAPEHEKPAWKCAELLHHASFSAGMLIDPIEVPEPEQADDPPAPPPPPPPPPSPPPSASVPQAVRTVPQPQPGPSTRLLLAFAVGAASGSTPGLSPSLTFGLGIRLDELSLGLETRYDFQSQRYEKPFTIRGSQRFGTLKPCKHTRARPWLQLDNCFLLSIGWLERSIEDENKPTKFLQENPTFTWGVGLHGGLTFPLGPSFALQARLDVLFVPDPPAEVVRGREIWTYPHASAAVQVGLTYAFDVARLTAKPSPPPPSRKISPTIGTSEGSGDI